MAFKDRYDGAESMTAIGDHTNTILISNNSSAEPWDDQSLTIVDGQLTVLTDTDDLCGVRFIVAPELVVTADINENTPDPEDPMVWYSYFCGRGPLVFRLLSKKTIHPEEVLWIQFWKARGGNLTSAKWGLNLMIQPHH